MNPTLETALHYAQQGKDLESLATLARTEARQSARWAEMLVAVLVQSGPVVVPDAVCESVRLNKYRLVATFLAEGGVQLAAQPTPP